MSPSVSVTTDSSVFTVANQDGALDVVVGLAARDQVRLQADLAGGSVGDLHSDLRSSDPVNLRIIGFRLSGVGCPDFLRGLAALRQRLREALLQSPAGFDLNKIKLDEGSDHSAMLFRELILRARGKWQPPYQEPELCHCRSVPTSRVDRAIVCGSHTIQQIARETSAGTSCGTCRMDSEALIRYRLAAGLTD